MLVSMTYILLFILLFKETAVDASFKSTVFFHSFTILWTTSKIRQNFFFVKAILFVDVDQGIQLVFSCAAASEAWRRHGYLQPSEHISFHRIFGIFLWLSEGYHSWACSCERCRRRLCYLFCWLFPILWKFPVWNLKSPNSLYCIKFFRSLIVWIIRLLFYGKYCVLIINVVTKF